VRKIVLFVVGLFLTMALSLSSFSGVCAAKKPIEFRWGTQMVFATLDPAQVGGNPMWVAGCNLYDTLVFPHPEKVYIPWIAKSWKVSEDGLKYTFYLKKGILFHDGTEITAEDVAFSMDRMLRLKESTTSHHFRIFLKPGNTKALDRHTVEFNLSLKAPQFMTSQFLFKVVKKKES